MKKYAGVMFSLMLVGCAQQPDAPPPPKAIGMANPAAVYCTSLGGRSIPVQTPQGTYSNCKLPSGEVIEEWALWRRDHPAKS